MFAVLSRSVVSTRLAHRSFASSARCLAKKNVLASSSGSRQQPQQVKNAPPPPPPLSADAPSPAPDPTPMHTPSPEASAPPPPPTPPTSSVPSLDFSPPDPSQQQEARTGAKSSKGSLSSTERKRRFMGRVSLALLAVALGANAVWMGREWEEGELRDKKLKIEDAPSTRWGRTKERFTDLFDYFNKPAWPELLPPPYPPPHQKPYTLLISIDDLLVTSTWDRQYGWRTAKRPGVDYFLAYISQFYETVIFTTQHYYTAAPILDKLDRYNFFINHRLFREATRSINGKIVKDLSYLNRDLSHVVMLDTDPEHVATHPENAVILPKWTGDPGDKGLIAMIPFLESIAIYKPADVRPILEAYKGKDIPLEYAKKEAEAKARHIADWEARHGKSGTVGGVGGVAGLFGLGSGSQTPRNVPPPTYLEQKRREAQQQYRDEQAYIEKNRADLEKLLEQEQQAMAAQVPGSLWEVFGGGVGAAKAGEQGVGAAKAGEQGVGAQPAEGAGEKAAEGVGEKKSA